MSIKELEKKIYELAKVQGLTNERVEPIIDGLYDPALFNGICWLMKEPFDEVIDGKPWGGGWSLIDCFEKPDAWKNRSWQPIIYSMYGIRYGLKYEDMDWLRDDPEMTEVLKHILYLNISKMPAFTRTSQSDLAQKYIIWRNLLREQIEYYDPTIVICAGTYSIIAKDFVKNGQMLFSYPLNFEKSMKVYEMDGRYWIDAYHPNQTVVTREIYVNAIIEIVNDLKSRKHIQ